MQSWSPHRKWLHGKIIQSQSCVETRKESKNTQSLVWVLAFPTRDRAEQPLRESADTGVLEKYLLQRSGFVFRGLIHLVLLILHLHHFACSSSRSTYPCFKVRGFQPHSPHYAVRVWDACPGFLCLFAKCSRMGLRHNFSTKCM